MPNNLVSPSAMADGGAQTPPPQQNALATPPTAPTPGAMATPQKSVHINEVKGVIGKQASIDRALRGLLKDGGPVPRKAVIDMAIELVAERTLSAQAMAGYLADLPEDPLEIRKWATTHAQTVEKGLDQLIGMVHGVGTADQSQPNANQPTMPNANGTIMQ